MKTIVYVATLLNLSGQSGALVTRTYNSRAISKPTVHKSAFQTKSFESTFQNNPILFMSSIEQDELDSYSLVETFKRRSDKLLNDIVESLPSPPEDPLALSGDIAAIGVYCFLDHFVNDLIESAVETPQSLAETSNIIVDDGTDVISQAINSMMGTDPGLSNTAGGVPVWFEAIHTAPFGTIPLSSALPLEHHVSYAPAISTPGMSFVLISSVWLFCGYFTGAFLYSSTLQCSLEKSVRVTSTTWFFTCAIMVAISLASQYIVGCVDVVKSFADIGLTKADSDFLFDSLGVLLFWRYILNYMLGYDDSRR